MRVVIVRVIVDGVLGVTIVVLIGHDEVLVIYVAIFVVIFCNWRCTLYTTLGGCHLATRPKSGSRGSKGIRLLIFLLFDLETLTVPILLLP